MFQVVGQWEHLPNLTVVKIFCKLHCNILHPNRATETITIFFRRPTKLWWNHLRNRIPQGFFICYPPLNWRFSMLKIPGVDQFPKRLEETLPRKGACDPCEAATSAQDGTMIYQNGERLHTCMYIYIYTWYIYIYIFYIYSICACMCVLYITYIYIYIWLIIYIYITVYIRM